MSLFKKDKTKICITYQNNDFGDTKLTVDGVDWWSLPNKQKKIIAEACWKNLNVNDYEYFLKWWVTEASDVHEQYHINEGSGFVNGEPVKEQIVWKDKVWLKI